MDRDPQSKEEIKNISEVIGKKAYTSDGDLFGQVEEVSLVDNKIEGWRIRVSSDFVTHLGGARGVIIPHQFVKSIGDVFIVNRSSLPSRSEESMDVNTASGSAMDMGSDEI